MDALIHIALADNGTVMAHFVDERDAADYCAARGYLHVPYNLRNRDSEPAPLVGTVYRV